MALAQAILYLAAVVLIALGALRVKTPVSLPLLGAGCFVLAYALPAITAAT